MVAILAVLILHTAAKQWYVLPPASSGWQVLNAYDSAARFCVPLFFMVSGALFLDPARNVTARSIWRRSLPRLAVAFVVWSAFYAVVNTFVFGHYTGMRDLLSMFAVGYYHQWFLWALMGLYIVTPFLRRLVAERSVALGFAALAVVFSAVIPLLSGLPLVGSVISTITETARVDLVLGYSLFFVLGHLLHQGLFARVATVVLILGFLVAVAVTAVGTSLLTARGGVADATLYAYLTPNVIVASVCIFLLVRRAVERWPAFGTSRAVAFIGSASFGIYLVHPFFQSTLLALGFTTSVLPELVSVPLFALALFVPSLIVATILHRIPRVGRYIS